MAYLETGNVSLRATDANVKALTRDQMRAIVEMEDLHERLRKEEAK